MLITIKRKLIIFISLAVVLVLVFGAGFYAGEKINLKKEIAPEIANKEIDKPESVDFSTFWLAWNILNEKFSGVGTTTSDQEKVWGAIQGLASSYKDPYTVFFPPEDAKIFEGDISGNFEGVGMEVGIRDGSLIVVAPLKGTPAERAGVKAGDKILKINDTVSIDMAVDKAIKLIRGPKGTSVTLLVSRNGKKEPFEIKIVRDMISVPTLNTELRHVDGMNKDGFPNNVFIIKLYNFSGGSTLAFRQALRDFINSGTNRLALDLRGNPGGYMDAAIDMASWFLPAGKVVVREKFRDEEDERLYKSRGYDVFTKDLKMVILTDGGSASASEILAGALKEQGVAQIVGTRTFGKGSVQELIKITPDTSLKVTVARWFTPNRVSISDNGLKPDYEVKITEADITANKDPQMDKAIKILVAE